MSWTLYSHFRVVDLKVDSSELALVHGFIIHQVQSHSGYTLAYCMGVHSSLLDSNGVIKHQVQSRCRYT